MRACDVRCRSRQAAVIARSIARLGFAGLLVAALALPLAAQAQQWRISSNNDGIRLESRTLPGERFDQLRASAQVPVAPQAVADFLVGDYLDQENKSIRRTFVKRTRKLTVWSDVLTAPAIDPRCYSMRFERSEPAADGQITVRFSTGDYIGSRPSGCITLRAHGEWSMRPVGNGTLLTYTSLTDTGGGTPAILASAACLRRR
jgi:hypothetical protein